METVRSRKNPDLAGQTARYLDLQLQDYRAGRRHGKSMEPIAQSLQPGEVLSLAEYFSRRKPVLETFRADPAKIAAGVKKADSNPCAMCHGGDFKGQNEIPRLAGQHYEYVKKALEDFKAKRRTNDGGAMTSVASDLSDEDIDDLAQYLATLY